MWKPRLELPGRAPGRRPKARHAERSAPIFRALAHAIAADVQSGRLRAGDRLPPQRDLADALGITVTTVTRGYEEAERLGLVRGEVGRGTFVRPPAFAPLAGREDALIDLATNALLPQAHAGELAARLNALIARTDAQQLFNYQAHAGMPEHRATAAAYLKSLGVPADATNTILTSGAQHAMTVAIGTIAAPAQTILCESVTYTGMRSLAHHLHVRLQEVALDGEGIIPDALEDAALESGGRVLYCMPSVQNPTGSIMSRKRRKELVAIADKINITIVEDDVYGFLVTGLPTLAALAPERTFYLSSLSKSLVPGLRLGMLRAPQAWIDRLIGAVFATTVTITPLCAAAGTMWMQDGTVQRVVEWKRQEIRARQQLARGILLDRVTGAVESQHVWLSLPPAWSAEDFAREARQRGVLVTPGREFAVARHDPPNAVRICLGPPAERPSLTRALRTLLDILNASPHAFGTNI
jgi:DNA-binding transcriptional MocR family regulator